MSTINGDLRPCGEFTSTCSCGRDEECSERDESGDLRPSYHYKCGEFPSTGFFGRDGKCQSGYVWKVMPTGVVRVRCGCCCWHRQNLLCSLCVAWGFVEQRQQRSHFLLTCKLSLQDESGKFRCRIHSACGHHVLQAFSLTLTLTRQSSGCLRCGKVCLCWEERVAERGNSKFSLLSLFFLALFFFLSLSVAVPLTLA